MTPHWSVRGTAVYGRSPPKAVVGPRLTAGPARRALFHSCRRLSGGRNTKKNWGVRLDYPT